MKPRLLFTSSIITPFQYWIYINFLVLFFGGIRLSESERIIEITEKFGANNYHPLPIVLAKGKGVWVWDLEGNKYMDMLSSYSAINHGHLHPKIVEALVKQAQNLTLTSRAFHNDQLGPFLKELCELAGFERALPMNTGAEAVETALKVARKWAYEVKKVPNGKAEIICCSNNFHGRTITIVSFSTDELTKAAFGPFTPGFKVIPYNDSNALKEAINENTAAFLVEPIQGEGGVLIPDKGYLKEVRKICTDNNILLVIDEVQTGFGRTGKLFCFEHEEIKPDVLILGKALGGGVFPVSMVLSQNDVLGLFVPGEHGSTFGGNPLGAAVGRASIKTLIEEKLTENALNLGKYFLEELKKFKFSIVKEVRGMGLMIGVEIKEEHGNARKYCEKLEKKGILAKETHEQVVRFAPPLVITKDEVDWALTRIQEVFGEN